MRHSAAKQENLMQSALSVSMESHSVLISADTHMYEGGAFRVMLSEDGGDVWMHWRS
ncbi:protein of unknown function [Acidithiobacillus ferrivorans]|uniref:Uncharacterized protein n=1 Tax=Acidithiobacillus ferrivorans TaxID=160808 RepID=A0A060UNI3_9PROT|nr:hypothetical protein AFERRI_40159 [Acidithiobacillus ferrivorans]SMH64168.1 protein of unknown function [Acidithiobacillus ferrivorans]